jgi:hypothetical protein
VTTTSIQWFEEYELPPFAGSVASAEAIARKQLTAAKGLNIHDLTEMGISHGLLTTALGDLLTAMETDRARLRGVA